MLKLPVPVPHEARRNMAKHAVPLQDFDDLEVMSNPKQENFRSAGFDRI